MTKITKTLRLAAFFTALVLALGSFPGGYNVTNLFAEGPVHVTGTALAEGDVPAADAEQAPAEDAEALKAAEEEAARIAAEEEAARKAAEEEAARKAAEEEEAARKAAEEEAARKAAEEEAARKAAEEEAARKAAEEEAARIAAEEEAARKAAEEEAARKAAEEAAQSEAIEGEPAPELDTPEDEWDDEEEEDWDEDWDEEEDGETVILEDWDAGYVSEDLLDRFDDAANYERMEFNGTAEIEMTNEGLLRFGDEIKLEAKVRDADLSYRLIWEANDDDERGWYTIASGEKYSYTLAAENLEREYRVVLYSVD